MRYDDGAPRKDPASWPRIDGTAAAAGPAFAGAPNAGARDAAGGHGKGIRSAFRAVVITCNSAVAIP